jgi:hypothetical protein
MLVSQRGLQQRRVVFWLLPLLLAITGGPA